MVVVAAASPIMVPELQPHLVAASGGVEELSGVCFLGAAGGAVAAVALGIFVLSLLPRFDGVGSVAVKELWRLVFRSPLRRRYGVFVQVLWKLLAGAGSLRRRRRSGVLDLRASGHGRCARPMWLSVVLGFVPRGEQLLRLSKPDDGDCASVALGSKVACLLSSRRGSGVDGGRRRAMMRWCAGISEDRSAFSCSFEVLCAIVPGHLYSLAASRCCVCVCVVSLYFEHASTFSKKKNCHTHRPPHPHPGGDVYKAQHETTSSMCTRRSIKLPARRIDSLAKLLVLGTDSSF